MHISIPTPFDRPLAVAQKLHRNLQTALEVYPAKDKKASESSHLFQELQARVAQAERSRARSASAGGLRSPSPPATPSLFTPRTPRSSSFNFRPISPVPSPSTPPPLSPKPPACTPLSPPSPSPSARSLHASDSALASATTPTKIITAASSSSSSSSSLCCSSSSLLGPSSQTPRRASVDAAGVASLQRTLEAERRKTKELRDQIAGVERKLEKDVEVRFQREYKKKIQEFKEMFESIKAYKSTLLSRPELAAEFRTMSKLPTMAPASPLTLGPATSSSVTSP